MSVLLVVQIGQHAFTATPGDLRFEQCLAVDGGHVGISPERSFSSGKTCFTFFLASDELGPGNHKCYF